MTRIFIAGAVLVDHLTCAFQKVLNLTKIKKVYWIAYFLCGNIMQFLRRPNRRSVDLIGLTILEYHIICFSIYTSLPFVGLVAGWPKQKAGGTGRGHPATEANFLL